MLRRFHLNPSKTYSTESKAMQAAEKLYGDIDLLYMIVPIQVTIQMGSSFVPPVTTLRYTPVFIGKEAVSHGIHHNFTVVG